jgi:hypothetical protein
LLSGFGGAIYEVNEFSIRLGSDIAAEAKQTTEQPLELMLALIVQALKLGTLVGFRSIAVVLTIPLLDERDFVSN